MIDFLRNYKALDRLIRAAKISTVAVTGIGLLNREEPDISRVLFSERTQRAVIYLGHLLPNASSGSL